MLSEFSLVLERIKISGPAANRTVEITVDYTEDRTDSLSLDSLAEISGAISQALDKAAGPLILILSSTNENSLSIRFDSFVYLVLT